MLRVGLTGSLGSGKSTVAGFLRELGAEVIEADELGRAMMEPGQSVYLEIVRAFGSGVVQADGRLNRRKLAELAFQGGRLNELNAIIHPAVIEEQRRWMREVFMRNPAAICVVESALIFEVERDARLRGETETVLADWRHRLDRIIAVVAPDDVKVARYAARVAQDEAARPAAEAEARNRLAHQIPDEEKSARADYVLENSGDLPRLRAETEALWQRLQSENNKLPGEVSLK